MLKAKQNPDWRYLIRLAEDILATLGQIIEMQKKMSEIFDRMLDDQPVPAAKKATAECRDDGLRMGARCQSQSVSPTGDAAD